VRRVDPNALFSGGRSAVGAKPSQEVCVHLVGRLFGQEVSGVRDEMLLERAGDVLGWVRSGKLQIRISQILPLQEAHEAHRLLQGRKTTGKILLVP